MKAVEICTTEGCRLVYAENEEYYYIVIDPTRNDYNKIYNTLPSEGNCLPNEPLEMEIEILNMSYKTFASEHMEKSGRVSEHCMDSLFKF